MTATAASGGAWRRGMTASGGGEETSEWDAGGRARTTRPVEEWGRRRRDGKRRDARLTLGGGVGRFLSDAVGPSREIRALD